MRRPSRNTLLGRVHEQAALEQRHDAEGLYDLIDPVIRERLEAEAHDESDLPLADIRRFVRNIKTVRVEEVEILEAHRISPRHGGRAAAVVRCVLRYNDGAVSQEFRSVWVRQRGMWYTTALGKSWPPTA